MTGHDHHSSDVLRAAHVPPQRAPHEVPPLRASQAHAEPTTWIRPGPTLLVASTGGHLDELVNLRARLRPELDDVEWVTFASEQAESLLENETVHYVPRVDPKDARGTANGFAAARRLLSPDRYARVISTGAAIAVPFIITAQLRGMARHYIESAARSAGVSLTGNIVSRVPGTRLYGQYPGWSAGRWQYRGSVFDGFTPVPSRPPAAVDKVVVTLGTQRGFGFRRALEKLVHLLPEVCVGNPTILWQTGATPTDGLPIRGHASVPVADLRQAVGEADLVIGHAGVGTALLALQESKGPLLLPRRAAHGEHTDDHQRFVGTELARRGLARLTDVDQLMPTDLMLAAGTRVTVTVAPAPFLLQPD